MTTPLDTLDLTEHPVPERMNRRDRSILSGCVSLGVVLAAGMATGLPFFLLVILAGLGAGLGVLAYLDAVTLRIENRNTLILAGVVAVPIVLSQLFYGFSRPILLFALGGAAGAFALMLFLGIMPGFMGGGDIKLAPVAGGVLALLNWFGVLLWIGLTLILAMVAVLTLRARGSVSKRIPMVPFMAAAVPLTIVASYFLTTFEPILGGPFPL